MAAPNDVQRAVLKAMPGYCIIMQWTQGALMVAPNRHYQDAKVIELDGQVYPFSHYLTMRDSRRSRPLATQQPPWLLKSQSARQNLPRAGSALSRFMFFDSLRKLFNWMFVRSKR